MTPEEQKDFNKQTWKYLYPDHDMPDTWNPYSDANDRNKVIEKMQIATDPDYQCDETCNKTVIGWECTYELNPHISSFDKSMEAAQIACIWKALEDRYGPA